MMIVSVIISAMVFPLVGKICDYYPLSNIIPIAFILRFVSTILFLFVKKPDSIYSYIVCVALIIFSIVENISVDSIFYKIIP